MPPAGLRERCVSIGQRKGHALSNGVSQGGPIVIVSQSEEDAARIGIVVWRPLTRQIG